MNRTATIEVNDAGVLPIGRHYAFRPPSTAGRAQKHRDVSQAGKATIGGHLLALSGPRGDPVADAQIPAANSADLYSQCR